ncbi:phage major capsid protein [Pelagibacterium lacus]|uniref:Phage major capsid protein n=1 Tax=Pelagibacterium lacus TaxID=2282655 RepID=A0A369W6Z2_9HYPH|nr:phage major capsid protein [Pelagibacterium lacus]RDE10348.1 phage major capsid protein [Pelagibacterium lacus]
MTTTAQVVALIEKQGEAFEAFKGKYDTALDETNTKVAALLVGGGAAEAANDNGSVIAAKTALGDFVKTGSTAKLEALAPKSAMTVGVDEDGGFVAPAQLDAQILHAQRDLSPFRRLARTVTTRANTYQIPFNLGGTTSGWVGETAGRPQTDTSKLTLLEFPAGEIYANPAVSQRILDDALVNIADFVINEIAVEFDAQESAAFWSGDGVNKPKGLLTYDTSDAADATRPFGTIQTVVSGNAAGLAVEGIIDLVYSLKAGYRRNGRFLANSRTLAALAKLKDGEGRPLLQPAIAEGIPATLLGHAIEADEGLPDIGANSTPLAFADWNSAYLINDRMGVRLLRDPYSAKPYVLFYTTKRVGGGLLDSNAIKLLKIASS